MENRFENKLGTFYRCILYCNYNIVPLGAGIPIITSQYASLGDNVDLLNTYAIGADRNNLGSAIQKEISRMSLGQSVVSMSGSFVGHYITINDHSMAEQGRCNKSDFDKMKDTEAYLFSKGFVGLLTPYNPDLGDWNILPATITSLTAKVDVFKNYLEEPRFQQQMKAKFNELMLNQFDIVDAILELMDLAIESIKQSHPELYIGWQNVRRTYDDASGHSTLPVTMSVTIPPNSYYAAETYPYLALRVFKLYNHGPNEVGFGLSDNAAGFSNYERIVQPDHTSNVQSSTLGSSGDILLLHNNTAEPITVDIWVFE